MKAHEDRESRAWSEEDFRNHSVCLNFILGVVQGSMHHSYALCARDESCKAEKVNKYSAFCSEKTVVLIEAAQLFVSYVDKRPALLQEPDPALPLMLSLINAYPCLGQAPK